MLQSQGMAALSNAKEDRVDKIFTQVGVTLTSKSKM